MKHLHMSHLSVLCIGEVHKKLCGKVIVPVCDYKTGITFTCCVGPMVFRYHGKRTEFTESIVMKRILLYRAISN